MMREPRCCLLQSQQFWAESWQQEHTNMQESKASFVSENESGIEEALPRISSKQI
jgi:hypothetical protein